MLRHDVFKQTLRHSLWILQHTQSSLWDTNVCQLAHYPITVLIYTIFPYHYKILGTLYEQVCKHVYTLSVITFKSSLGFRHAFREISVTNQVYATLLRAQRLDLTAYMLSHSMYPPAVSKKPSVSFVKLFAAFL